MNKFIVYTEDDTTHVFDSEKEVNAHVSTFYKAGEKWHIIKPGEPVPPRVYNQINPITRVMDKLEFDVEKFNVYLEAHPELTLLEAAKLKCSPTLFKLIQEEFGIGHKLYQTFDGKVWREPKPNSQPYEYLEYNGKTYLLSECLVQEDIRDKRTKLAAKLNPDEIQFIKDHGL